MNLRSKMHGGAAVLLVGALIALGAIWWINGRDDTWLYAACALIVLTSFVPLVYPKNKDK